MPGNALLCDSAPHGNAAAGNSSAKAKAATAIDHSQTLLAEKASWGLYDVSHWSAADAKLPEGSKNGKDVISEGMIMHGSGVGHGPKAI